jgi:hypothetical protein
MDASWKTSNWKTKEMGDITLGFKVDGTNPGSCPVIGFVSSSVESYGSKCQITIELCTVLNHLLYGNEATTFVPFCGYITFTLKDLF